MTNPRELALTEAADSQRDRAAGCADCTGQTCGNCQHRLTAAARFDATARSISTNLYGEPPDMEAEADQ
jgi:hypothetical protein